MAFPHVSEEPVLSNPVEESASRPTPPALPARLSGLSRVLRMVGAGALLASASSFLLQHWDSGGDLVRYYTLLGHTAVLAVLGFVWGLRANDAKGARTFLALSAGLVPANFMILGGLVYSQFAWDGAAVAVASYATWVAPSGPAALVAVAASLVALGGVVALAFAALTRERALGLAALYLASNALVLVPSRDPTVVAVLAGFLLCGLLVFERTLVRATSSLRTLEGGFVRAMLFAAPLLMLIRSALHYDVSAAFFAVTSGAVAVASLALSLEERMPALGRAALRGGSLAALLCCAFSGTVALVESFGVPGSAALPIGGLGFGAAATGLSLLAGPSAWGALYRRIAAWVVLATLALDLWVFPGVVASLCCGIASIVTLSYGFLAERRALFFAGLAGAVLSVATHLQAAMALYAWSHWGSLAGLGVAVVLAATAVERHGEAIGERALAFRRRIAGWE